jgi:predicted nuclease of predicted toxin-antitoxin system
LTRLVLDEQLSNPRLVAALRDRGIDASVVADYGVTGRPDPDVVRRIDDQESDSWVLVTMDLTVVEDFPGFDWSRYAIAWVQVRDDLRGARVEYEKTDIIQRHAHTMREQVRGDHYTYMVNRHFKHRPSLATLISRKKS